MGVLNLWKILSSTCRPVELDELKDKTLAVDLSIWICENSTQTKSFNFVSNTKPYLRALFFRCKYLLELNCKLIFVREGDIIDLKQDTMKKRNQNRFGDSQSQQQSQSKPIQKRSRYDSIANECCELLKGMGITVIRSPCGEAEKACAYLNLIGRCDAVITEDSDVLLYGAKCVYRNFSLDKKSQVTIEEYKMEKIESELGYSREMLIVLGLLLGCDYDMKGIPGVGKELACKFLNEIIELNQSGDATQIDIFNLVRNWSRKDSSLGLKYEERVKKLVLASGNQFPNEEIIQEYVTYSKMCQILLREEKYLTIKWNRPNLMSLQLFNDLKQAWAYDYTASKVISLIVLYEYSHVKNKKNCTLKPIRINKIKRQSFVEYYEVAWSKMNAWDLNDKDLSDLTEYSTLEKLDLFQTHYPDLVNQYNEKIESKKASRKSKKKKVLECESNDEQGVIEIDDQLANSLMEMYENYSFSEQNENSQNHTIIEVEKVCSVIQNSVEVIEESVPNDEKKKKKKKKIIARPEQLETGETKNKIREMFKDDSNEESEQIQAKSNGNLKKKKKKKEIKIIVLDTESDTEQDKENSKPVDKIVQDLDLNALLDSFENITLNPNKNKKEKAEPEPKVVEFEIDIPFSQRMKKIYKNASIFD